MGKIILTEYEEQQLKTHNIIKTPEYYRKYCANQEKIVEKIITHQDLLTKDLYAIPIRTLYTSKNQFIGVDTTNYQDYYETNCKKINLSSLNRQQIIVNLLTVLRELSKLGIIYYDIHSGNILANVNSEIKVIDLDGALFKNEYFNEILLIRSLLSYILEIYLFDNIKFAPIHTLSYVLNKCHIEESFTPQFVEYLNSVYNCECDIWSDNIPAILTELEDKNRIQHIKKRLI